MNKNNKSTIGLIIIIMTIFVIFFAIWFFFIRSNNTTTNKEKTNNKESIKKEEKTIITKEEFQYEYKDGVLIRIVDKKNKPKQNDFIIDGIILIGEEHSYFDTFDSNIIINNFVEEGYKKEDINSEFYLEENINIYLDTQYEGENSNIKIIAIPHNKIEGHNNKNIEELQNIAQEKGFIIDYIKPDEEQHKYLGSASISMDCPAGKYDMLFIYKNNIAYYLTINMKKNVQE